MLEFFTISLIIILVAISPGPDFILVSRNALLHSQRIGVMVSLGIAVGTLFHAAYCILGFAIVISKSLLLFNIIKYLGAGYLIYLGVKGLFEKQKTTPLETEIPAHTTTSFRAFIQGLCCNVLNPKAVMFFLALFTVVIKPSMPLGIQVGYGIEIALVHFIWFSLLSMLFAHDKVRHILGSCMSYVSKAFSGALLFLGLKIATLSQS